MKRGSFGAAWGILLLGCSGITVKRDYDTSVDFGGFKAYAWRYPPGEATGGPRGDALMDPRIRAAVDQGLADKGHEKTPLSKADYLVDYHYVVEQETEEDRVRGGVGVGAGSYGGFGSISVGVGSGVQPIDWETLTLDVVEPKTGRLLWRGFARQELIRSSDPDRTTARVRSTVKAILAKFPPQD